MKQQEPIPTNTKQTITTTNLWFWNRQSIKVQSLLDRRYYPLQEEIGKLLGEVRRQQKLLEQKEREIAQSTKRLKETMNRMLQQRNNRDFLDR